MPQAAKAEPDPNAAHTHERALMVNRRHLLHPTQTNAGEDNGITGYDEYLMSYAWMVNQFNNSEQASQRVDRWRNARR